MSGFTLIGLFLMTGPLAGFAQNQELAREVQASIQAGVQAKANGDLAGAERIFSHAVTLGRRLPRSSWLAKAETLKHLAFLHQDPRRIDEAEDLLRERVDVVRASAPLDPKLGIALFDLQSVLAASGKIDGALKVATEAEAYYRGPCSRSAWSDRCDRRLADVETLMGGAYFIAKRYDDAEPWLKKVVDRPDEGTRPESMLVALRGYATILYARKDLQSAAVVYRRALTFERAHPEAARSIGEWANEPQFR